MHIHLREGEILDSVIGYTASCFSNVLVMPNLNTPITNTDLALKYKNEIQKTHTLKAFNPILSIYITDSLNKDELIKAKENGIKILKLYPKGSTTGSESGISDILDSKTLGIFQIAQDLGFILSIHGESNGFCMDREFEFGEIFSFIAQNFPKLKIIMEHLSDRRSIDLLEKYDNLFATLTLHHITMSLDDVIGGGLNPHHFCKPNLKTPRDKEALINLALNAHPKVSFGSDSAPHLLSNKLKTNAAAGIFSAPVLLPKLCEIFDEHNKLENLQKFISNNAMQIYELENPRNTKEIVLIKKDEKVIDYVPCGNDKIIPLFAGENIKWRISICMEYIN